jgi:SAM-dependent methyltransferase
VSPLTRANLRHLLTLFFQGSNPVSKVYESIGHDFFLSPAPGWLNLGLWEGPGDEEEAEEAVRRLVITVAGALPRDGVVLDAGNGLGAQDPVIAEVARPSMLIALNITEAQLRAGRAWLRDAGAHPVAGDAGRIPLASRSVDGVISIEAAFHFPSRAEFFSEARRVLRPGGVLAMSDVSAERKVPHTPPELIAGLVNVRAWALRRSNLIDAEKIGGLAEAAGFTEVEVDLVGDRVFGPAIRFMQSRLSRATGAPLLQRLGAGVMLRQWSLLHRRKMMEYLIVRARAPA